MAQVVLVPHWKIEEESLLPLPINREAMPLSSLAPSSKASSVKTHEA